MEAKVTGLDTENCNNGYNQRVFLFLLNVLKVHQVFKVLKVLKVSWNIGDSNF